MQRKPHRRPSRSAGRSPLPTVPIHAELAATLGWTSSAVRHAVACGELERPQRAVLVSPADACAGRVAAAAANLRRAQAASLTCSRAAISHVSATIAHGVPTFGAIDPACLTVPAGTALRNLAHVHLHRASVRDDEIVVVDGYRVLNCARTVLDVARERGVAAGVVAADYALHEKLITREELSSELLVCAGWPGRKAARITAAFADEAAESPLESLSRLQMAAAGLPKPKPQVEICDEFGVFLGRGDFYWDEFGVVGESDGNLKYESGSDSIVYERGREKDFWGTGLIVVRWGWADLYPFDKVAARLRTAYARGARPGSPERKWGVLRPRLHP